MIALSDLPTGRLGELQSAHWALRGVTNDIIKMAVPAIAHLSLT